MKDKTVVKIIENIINPINKVKYAYKLQYGDIEQVLVEDEVEKIRRKGNTEFIDESVDVYSVPRDSSYMAQKYNPEDVYMQGYTGDVLLDLLDKELKGIDGSRDMLQNLYNTLMDKESYRVILLHGLRRTGKSIMMYQAVEKLIKEAGVSPDEICIFTVYDERVIRDDISRAIDEAARIKKMKYIFIDEVTMIPYITGSSQYLYDLYTKRGVKLVLTGTHSYAINLLRDNSLSTRCTHMRVTPVSYSEYCRLCGYTSVMDYIKVGGIFTDDFKGFDTMHGYIYSAISNNIAESILKNGINTTLGVDASTISGIVNRILYDSMCDISAGNFNKEFNLRLQSNGKIDEEFKTLMRQKVNDLLPIEIPEKLDKSTYTTVMNILLSMDVLNTVSDFLTHEVKYLLTRFSGLVYVFCNTFASASVAPEIFKVDIEEAKLIMEKYRNTLEGFVLEGLVMSDIMSLYREKIDYRIGTLNIGSQVEVDITVHDTDANAINLIEVKRSDSYQVSHLRWLVDVTANNEVIRRFRAVNRIVVYNGPTFKKIIDDEIIQYKKKDEKIKFIDKWKDEITGGYDERVKHVYFINANEFLMDPDRFLFQDGLRKILAEGESQAKILDFHI